MSKIREHQAWRCWKGACAFWLALFPCITVVCAGPRSSTSYAITTDTADSGGTRSTSAAYANVASLGGLGGVSTVASPAEMVRSGYVGQIYEVVSVQISAITNSVNEGGTLQLSASAALDDSTTLTPLAGSVAWSIVTGPIASISTAGLLTAGNVYQNTPASVKAGYLGVSGSLGITVLNVGNDDLGIYASDGIPDSWQVQYFGSNNPKAAPNFISDGSGLTNLFKFTAGLIPNNSASTFSLNSQPVTNQPGQSTISFGPAFADRQYTLQFSTDLTHWNILNGPNAGNGGTMTFTDTNAGGLQKFYRVQVTKP